jgi:4-aminobutyrate aminotransferase-like enzyme
MIDQPPRVPLSAIRKAVAASYRLEGEFTPLDGERDQNHRLVTPAGSFVIKVCNPAEGHSIVDCQLKALEHIADVDPELPVPRVRRTINGTLFPELKHDGMTYPLAALSWLEGRILGLEELNGAQYVQLGETIGRLNKALRGFVHPAPADRKLIWHTAEARALETHLHLLEGKARTLAELALRENGIIKHALMALPAQIMHADVHPYNTLINEVGSISGIIDFGDMIHGARVIELANAMADCLNPGRDLATIAKGLVRGFVRQVPLSRDEAALVLPLVHSRLALSALVTAMRRKEQGHLTPQIEALDALSIELLAALQNNNLEAVILYAANQQMQPPSSPVAMMQRRLFAMGPRPLLFYSDPLHMVKGEGVWLTASDGRRYLDCYNNVPHVGHCNPSVVEAVSRQLRVLNTNTRYLTNEAVNYAERLKATLDPSLDTVIFVNSGSEANDVAWRMAKAWTGNRGLVAMDFAYHGVTEASDAMSPSNYPAGKFVKPHVRQIEAPDDYRGPYRRGDNDLAGKYAALIDPEIDALRQQGLGVALGILDSAFMTNGILDAPIGYVKSLVEKLHAAGGLFVADEVQSGFGRMAPAYWGHQHHGVTPDFVTIGKPAGNGYPVGAIITRAAILDKFVGETGPFFSTFGGGNAACAAGIAVMDVIEHDGLVQRAAQVGQKFRDRLRELMQQHEIIGDVRGVGLATGVELVHDRATLEPAAAETKQLLNLLRDNGVLIGSDGKFGNVLKLRPPLVFETEHVEIAISAFDRALSRLQRVAR